MSQNPKFPIQRALFSLTKKEGLKPILALLAEQNVSFIATGGTAQYIREAGYDVTEVGDLTGYPSILGGRVKTLHPVIFGGILAVQNNEEHLAELDSFGLQTIDLVAVDLYPFESAVAQGLSSEQIIENIDIGGVALLRAAAKNYQYILTIPSHSVFPALHRALAAPDTDWSSFRLTMAQETFAHIAQYDLAIANWFSFNTLTPNLRYGENPHQKAHFLGNIHDVLTIHAGKELSYNNLLDVDAALRLITEFTNPTFAIFKHTNPCGVASANNTITAWEKALACDPVSAFGGIIITNQEVDSAVAQAINKQFFEVLLAPSFTPDALEVFKDKPKRILATYKNGALPTLSTRSIVNGLLVQNADASTTPITDYQYVTDRKPDVAKIQDMHFGEICAKHLKSNAIALICKEQLIGAGSGQTSRIDALEQAIAKCKRMGFTPADAVLVSDGFFPFDDAVRLAHQAGITHILQPGGSMRDADSIQYCNENNICMILTGKRHFRH